MAKEKLISTNTLLYYHTALKNLLSAKVDKVSGYSLMSDTEITRLSSVVNYDDTAVQSAITTMQGQINALQSGTYDDTQLRADIASTYATIANLNTHTQDTDIHITASERIAWNAKLGASDIADLATTAALETHTNNGDIHVTKTQKDAWDAKADVSTITDHTGNTTVHVTADERTSWNAKVSTTEMNNAISALETTINGKLTSAMHYKGSVSTFADLPSDPEVGDVYNIETAGTDTDSDPFPAGSNAAWNGTSWDVLSGVLDTSVIYTTSDMAVNSDIDTILNS